MDWPLPPQYKKRPMCWSSQSSSQHVQPPRAIGSLSQRKRRWRETLVRMPQQLTSSQRSDEAAGSKSPGSQRSDDAERSSPQSTLSSPTHKRAHTYEKWKTTLIRPDTTEAKRKNSADRVPENLKRFLTE